MDRSKGAGFLILANYLPLIYLLTGACLVWRLPLDTWERWGIGFAWIYLLPPLAARALQGMFGKVTATDATPHDRAYKLWWLLTQIQMPFNRLPMLEELLRLVPGLYAFWLNLWGSHVSPFVFWAPGALCPDRYLLEVRSGAVLGTRCVLSGHLVTQGDQGNYRLTVARVLIEEGAVIGVAAGISPGCRVHAHETVPAGRLLPPFTSWKDGRKNRGEDLGIR